MTVYADLLRYRELFANLFRRDFQAKYKGSVLGVVWSLVNPIVLLGVYLLVFGLIFPNQNIAHYPVYLLAGLASWIFFAVSMQSAARSMVDSAELIKKVRFPRQLVAFSMVATQAVTYAVMMAILVVLSLIFVPDARSTVWLALPLAVVFVGFVAGLALFFACLNVLYRDVEHVLAAALLPVVLRHARSSGASRPCTRPPSATTCSSTSCASATRSPRRSTRSVTRCGRAICPASPT